MKCQVDVIFAEGYTFEDAPDEAYAIQLAKDLFYDTYPNLKGQNVDVKVSYERVAKEVELCNCSLKDVEKAMHLTSAVKR